MENNNKNKVGWVWVITAAPLLSSVLTNSNYLKLYSHREAPLISKAPLPDTGCPVL